MGDNYKKSKGNAGLEGVQFQLNLLTVFLLNALHGKKNWKISTENQEAGKFDDLVFDFEDKCVLLQAKFKQHKKINKEQLFSCNSKTADFSLPKYFFSYLEVKSESVEKTVIICTNTSIDEKGLKGFLTRRTAGPDSMLHYEGATCTFLTFNENILPDLKANAETYLLKNLQGKGIDNAVVTEENLKDFLDHLQFFSNYPGGEKLEAIVGQLLLRLNSSSLYRGVSSQEIYKKVEEWFKQPKGEYLNELRAKAMFGEIRSDKYCEELKSHNLSFKSNDFKFMDPKRFFYFNSEKNLLLHALRIYYALQNNEGKQLFVNPEDGVEAQKCVIEAFALPRYVYLIIVGIKPENAVVKELVNILMDILKKYSYKKIIFSGKFGDKLSQQIEPNDLFHVDRPVTFEDFSLESQMKLIKQNNIIFQGKRVSLKELLRIHTSEDWTKAVNAEILEDLIRKNEIKVGEPPQELDELDSCCYIYRTFKRQVLKNVKSKEETLRQKLFLDIDEESSKKEESFAEEDIYDVKENVVLISDSAGMGKTTVLSKLGRIIKERNPHLWMIKVELNDYTVVLRNVLKNRREALSVMDLLNAKNSTKLMNHLEKFAFFTTKKVVLMIDGIDEISPDYTKLVLNVLSQCLQATNFAKLFVTTRPHMVRELEEVLKVKSFELQSFTEQNQVDFLTRYWAHNLDVDDEDKRNCELYAGALISRMSSWTKGNHNKEDDFTAIPLQLGMLAEIFQESIKQDDISNWEGCKEYLKYSKSGPKLPEKMEIKNLYDMFVEKKKDVFLCKGNPSGNATANIALTEQFDQSLVYHRKLALKVILNVENYQLFSCYERGYEDVDERILKIGIVQKSNGELHFIHRTFAEYFVSGAIVYELQFQINNPSVKFQKLFLEEILQLSEYKVIRAFLDNFLQEIVDSLPPNIFNKYNSSVHYPNYWTQDINLLHLLGEEGCTAIMKLILKCVDFKIIADKEFNMADLPSHITGIHNIFHTVAQKLGFKKEKGGNILRAVQILVQAGGLNIKDKFGRTPLHYAASGGHFEMVRFLAKRGVKTNTADKDGHTALHFASMTENLDSVKFLAESRDAVNVKDINGLTALHFAAANGREVAMGLFLGLNADFNVRDKYGRTPLHLAASEGHLNIIKFLLKLGIDFNVTDNYGRTPLHLSASNGCLDIVELLLQLGAGDKVRDNYNRTPLHLAASNGHLDTVKFLFGLGIDLNIRDSYNRTPLHLAASNGHLDTVKFILEKGIDLIIKDNYSHTPLHLASSNGHVSTVKFLLELGADLNAVDKDGCMTMHLAASNGHLDTVKLFLQLGVRFNVKDKYGRLPLHLAASNGHLDMVKFLLQLGLDYNIKDIEGRIPLHLAASNGHLDTVKLFLEIGADLNAMDDNGRTPLHLAALNGYLDTVNFLKEQGAYTTSRGIQ